MAALAAAVRDSHPDFLWTNVRANTTRYPPTTDAAAEAEANALLAEANGDDQRLWAMVEQRI